MKTKLAALAAIATALTFNACSNVHTPAVAAKNKSTFLNDPTWVGQLKDGRKVGYYEVDRGFKHNHFIYIIEGSNAVTVNQTVQAGKSSYNQPTVIVNDRIVIPD